MVDPIHVKSNDFFGSDPTRGSGKTKGSTSSGSESTASQSVQGRDEVVLSQLAQDIQTVKKHMDDVPADQLEKFKTIQDQVQKGTYKLDSGKIAEKMRHGHQLDKLT